MRACSELNDVMTLASFSSTIRIIIIRSSLLLYHLKITLINEMCLFSGLLLSDQRKILISHLSDSS